MFRFIWRIKPKSKRNRSTGNRNLKWNKKWKSERKIYFKMEKLNSKKIVFCFLKLNPYLQFKIHLPGNFFTLIYFTLRSIYCLLKPISYYKNTIILILLSYIIKRLVLHSNWFMGMSKTMFRMILKRVSWIFFIKTHSCIANVTHPCFATNADGVHLVAQVLSWNM